jgi:hypothetical protein
MDIVAAIIPYILAVFIIIKICIVEARNKRKEREEIEEIEREFERKEREEIEEIEREIEREEREEREKLEKLTKLNQQKEEIEKQVFKEDEYNLYVDQQIIKEMCLSRLRKEYSDHSYILYKKLLEDIKIAKMELNAFYRPKQPILPAIIDY